VTHARECFETWECKHCKREVDLDVYHVGVGDKCVAVRIWLFRTEDGSYVSRSKVLKE